MFVFITWHNTKRFRIHNTTSFKMKETIMYLLRYCNNGRGKEHYFQGLSLTILYTWFWIPCHPWSCILCQSSHWSCQFHRRQISAPKPRICTLRQTKQRADSEFWESLRQRGTGWEEKIRGLKCSKGWWIFGENKGTTVDWLKKKHPKLQQHQ